ncbi:translation initiation factor IF-2 [Lacunimicrobium album]
MKIRIFALAKEWNLDSKDLIKHCNDAGVPVKSSPLSSISPEERDLVLDYINKLGVNQSSAAPSKATLAPVRESVTEQQIGKVRAISAQGRGKPQRAESFDDEDDDRGGTITEEPELEDEPVAIEEEEPADDFIEEEIVAEEEEIEEPVEAVPEPVARKEAPVVAAPQAPADVEVAEEAEEEPEDEGEGDAPEAEAAATQVHDQPKGAPAKSPGLMSREAAAASALSRIREMRPRGAITDIADRKPPKQKPKPSLPTLALPPKYKPGVPKKDMTAPAQRPEIKLSAEVLESKSPLAAHLKKSSEQKKIKITRDGDIDTSDSPIKRGHAVSDPREARKLSRTRRVGTGRSDDDEERISRNYRRPKQRRGSVQVELKSTAEVEVPVSIRAFSEALGRPAKDIIRALMSRGQMATMNDSLEEEEAIEIAMELGVDLKIKQPYNAEDELEERINLVIEDHFKIPRPPIVTILGHVDHGKTTLVDTIRSANVAGGEAGGITQHIAAYQVDHHGKRITFVDTPGHAAFGEMRARGANLTDIVVLVVAANDGVMPQTEECISHAKAAGVPIIVALNKVDLPGINEQKVLQQLASHNILPAEWGGDVEVVRTSGLAKIGIENLLETILLTAELHDYKALSEGPSDGVSLEAFRDEGLGPIAWSIVRQGALEVGDVVLCGSTYGRIRSMFDTKGQEISVATPSTPIRIAGLNAVPNAGDHFYVMDDIDQARQIAEARQQRGRSQKLARFGGPRKLEDILSSHQGVKDLPLILKADAPGSLEALKYEIGKIDHAEVRVKILHEGVGGVNESDIYLASASSAIIIAFHVIADDRTMGLADHEEVEIRRYDIIYEVTDHIRQALEGMLTPDRVEVSTGRAIILRTFDISRIGRIAGCRVLSGTIERNSRIHVIRDQKILNNYGIASLKREKDDAKEVREGFECGIRLDGFNDIKEGDLLEAFRIDEIKRTL